MKNGSRSMGNHPMQPLSPKRQPWAMTQAPPREKALAETYRFQQAPCIAASGSKKHHPTVQQEIILREKIEQRTMARLEKLHEAVGVDRLNRRLQRQKSAGSAGEIVKALKEQEDSKRSTSVGRNI